MQQYLDLVQHILAQGTRKENRTGVDTISTFGYYYEHDMRTGFPLLTTKSISWKNIVIELLWFLSGSNNNSFLERHGCKFWRPWYNPDGSVNAAYGPAWRRFAVHDIVGDVEVPAFNDQIRWVVDRLISKPMSRDLVVSAWQPGIAQKPPSPNAYWAPCHCMFIFNVQNTSASEGTKPCLCLHLTQRSADAAIGVPFNLASYALLLQLMSRFSGIPTGVFGHSLVDLHLYTSKPDGSKSEFDHIPGVKEQIARTPRSLPRLIISDSIRSLEDVEGLLAPDISTEDLMSKFCLEGYDPAPAIKFVVAP